MNEQQAQAIIAEYRTQLGMMSDRCAAIAARLSDEMQRAGILQAKLDELTKVEQPNV